MLTKEGHVENDKIISNGITIKHMYILMSALFRCMYLVVWWNLIVWQTLV